MLYTKRKNNVNRFFVWVILLVLVATTAFVTGCTVHSASGPGRSWGNLAGGVFFDASLVKGEGQSFSALGNENVKAFAENNPLSTFNDSWREIGVVRAGTTRSISYQYTPQPIGEEASQLIHKIK